MLKGKQFFFKLVDSEQCTPLVSSTDVSVEVRAVKRNYSIMGYTSAMHLLQKELTDKLVECVANPTQCRNYQCY
jgi:hypothetical protein